MFHSRTKVLLAVLFILGKSAAIWAQTSGTSNPTNGRENNPYSRYGIGELSNGNNTVLRGMANVSSAFENPYEVNTDNPASYSFLQRTTFEVGAVGSTRTIVTPGYNYTTGTASIAYIDIAMPIGKKGGLCFGFKPYSKVYYRMEDTTVTSSIGQVIRRYDGDGGLNYAFVGGSLKAKGLSLGFNLGYLFGTLQNSSTVFPSDSPVTNMAYITQFTNYNRIGGLYWKGGLMYEHQFDSSLTFRMGGTVNIGQNITERLNAFQIASFDLGDSLIRDTMAYGGEQRGKLRMPLSYSAGISIGKADKWNLGLDYTGTQWNTFSSDPDKTLTYGVGKQSYKFSLGGEYTPDANNIRNYFARVTYRLGAYYGADYLQLNNTVLPVYGATAGASLPFRRSLSHLHLALDVGRLGTNTNNLLQQTYVRFSVGISFNDKWFIPRKYE